MNVNGQSLLDLAPILDMVPEKTTGPGGTSFGLGEAGYDIRIKQDIKFYADANGVRRVKVGTSENTGTYAAERGRFCLASAMEEFQMPDCLTGVVHDKSTWARRGLSVFNTVIEPGWKGFLTLELVYHGESELIIPAGAGIAQVLFHLNTDKASYTGKYQNQEDKPVPALDSL